MESRSEVVRSRAFDAIRRRTVSVAAAALVKMTPPLPGQIALTIEPRIQDVQLSRFAGEHRTFLEQEHQRHGAILFRGFPLRTCDDFHLAVESLCDQVMTYKERSSPRTEISRNVYTSTDYPNDQAIFPHNEHSYAWTFPRKLFFWCEMPPDSGGATPLGDTRRILARIDPSVRDRFEKLGWMYVRNFGERFGLRWQATFQTSDRDVVMKYCEANRMTCEWRSDGNPRTRQVRPVTIAHDKTGEQLWFNHLTFFHVSTLPRTVREAMLASYAEADLPNMTYYGDGSPIEADVLEHLREAYLSESRAVPWQRGDLIMLDNTIATHAREPFTGPRRILFAMADQRTRTEDEWARRGERA